MKLLLQSTTDVVDSMIGEDDESPMNPDYLRAVDRRRVVEGNVSRDEPNSARYSLI